MSDLDPERSRDTVYDTMQLLAGPFQALLGEPGQDSAPRERQEIPVE